MIFTTKQEKYFLLYSQLKNIEVECMYVLIRSKLLNRGMRGRNKYMLEYPCSKWIGLNLITGQV